MPNADCNECEVNPTNIKNRRKWSLDRSFTISHLLYALMILGSCVLWFAKIESNLAVHSSQITEIKDTIKLDRETTEAHLNRIEDKLDNLLTSKVRK